jgi:hypothetical protein
MMRGNLGRGGFQLAVSRLYSASQLAKEHMEHKDEIQRNQKNPVACGHHCHKEHELRSGTRTARDAFLVGPSAPPAAAGMHGSQRLSVRLQAL